jgi:phenylpropionate dioxygenase-like ring-hydroxylating dioxygenase large terminal subunit
MVKAESSRRQSDTLPASDRLGQLIGLLRHDVHPEQGRIPAYIFSSPEIFELEMERIFPRCWLLVAHESEIAKPGDYVTRSLGQYPVIVVRGGDDKIRILLNVCRHRGMRVCRADSGNGADFLCPYHGFNYKNTGELNGVPFEKDSYGTLDKSKLGLLEMKIGFYHGLIFGAVPGQRESLEQFLDGMKWYLDLYVKRATMSVAGPPQRWVVQSNWKLPAENFASDAYHVPNTHACMPSLGLFPNVSYAKFGYHIHAGNGHGIGIGTGVPDSPGIWPETLLQQFEKNLSPEQFALLKTVKNAHGTVFPNLSFLTSSMIYEGQPIYHTTMRLWQPVGYDTIEVVSWVLVEKDTPEEWQKKAQRAYIHTFGSSGMLEQDDTENWVNVTENSRRVIQLPGVTFNYQMGLGRKPMDSFPGPGEVYECKFHEANARAFYRRWLDLLLRDDGDVSN